MRRHARAELHRQHLRAEANAEKRPPLAQRNGDPVDLAANVIVRIVRAHRTAEDDRAGMRFQGVRQRVTEPWPADVEAMPKRAQHIADAAGARGFLMQDDQDGPRR